MNLAVFFNIKIYRTFAFVTHSFFQNGFNHRNLLYNMSGSTRFDAGFQHIEFIHGGMIAVSKILYHFHRFQLLKACFFCNFIFAFVGIIFEVANIGNITHIAHFEAQVLQVTKYQVEGNSRTGMA